MTSIADEFGLFNGKALPILTAGQDYTAGAYYMPTVPFMAANGANAAVGNNTIYYAPFLCRYAHTFTGLGFVNTVSVNTYKFRLGIYSSTAGRPGTRVVDSGELTVGDASTNVLREIAISQALDPNTLYWLAYIGNTSSTLKCFGAGGNHMAAQEVGFTATEFAGGIILGRFAFSESFAYAALPATATPGALVDTSATNAPIVVLKG